MEKYGLLSLNYPCYSYSFLSRALKLTIIYLTARNKKEIEFLQGAFESYKSSLHQEMDDKWNRKKTDLTNELEQQKDKEIHEMSK